MMRFNDLVESDAKNFTVRRYDELKLQPSHFNVAELWGVNMKKRVHFLKWSMIR